jgi:uracil-DNA glycosylase family 4
MSAADVAAWAGAATLPEELDALVSVCRACPRLVAWREEVASVRRASFAGEQYWGRPVPSWGPHDGRPIRVLVVGLAPAAHGGNRTGRIFTGDRSGDWLFASMFRVGLASQPTSVRSGDGLRLLGTRIVAPVHCAPPANKPTPTERDTCSPWLVRDLELARPTARAVVALGAFAWGAALTGLRRAGYSGFPSRVPVFGHGAEVQLGDVTLLGCYHPSQQNTFTGRLTAPMTDAVLSRAAVLAGLPSPG